MAEPFTGVAALLAGVRHPDLGQSPMELGSVGAPCVSRADDEHAVGGGLRGGRLGSSPGAALEVVSGQPQTRRRPSDAPMVDVIDLQAEPAHDVRVARAARHKIAKLLLDDVETTV
ncbi:hypothetical protein AB0L50_11045 [Streptomyces flaveolus]|uniref:hypothetical protein n=1 Tax=Streptomyces flaveolus TaxID=67297 RepID=UPI0034293A1A